MFYVGQSMSQSANGKRWRGYLTYYDAQGKRRRVTRMLDAQGKRDARRELSAWRAEMEDAAQADAGRTDSARDARELDAAEYTRKFIDLLERNGSIEQSTAIGYRASCKQIAQGLGGVPIPELDPGRIQAWEAELTASGLSSSTVCKAHRLLHESMRYAVLNGTLDRNPTDGVRPPKRANKNPGINALDAETYRKTLATLTSGAPTRTTAAATLALLTGMRNAEVCGLQWGDYNAETGELTIARAIGRARGGTYVKRTKTDRVRRIFLPRQARDTLAKWRTVQVRDFARLGAHVTPRTYVFGDPVGYLCPHTLTNEWHAIADALGLRGTAGRRPTFHDLRHTWATLYIANGGDAVTAANNLGHANPSMTLDVYASKDPDAQRQAPRLIESIIDGSAGKAPAQVIPIGTRRRATR